MRPAFATSFQDANKTGISRVSFGAFYIKNEKGLFEKPGPGTFTLAATARKGCKRPLFAMGSCCKWVLSWIAFLGLLAGTHPTVLGTTEEVHAEGAGKREFIGPEPSPRSTAAESSLLEKWGRVAQRPPVKSTHPVRLPAHAWIRFFQKFISPVDGHSCSYYPSCSAYGLQAIEKHGLLLGIPMTAERIMRNHRPENPVRYPLCEKGGRFYHLDPVELNHEGRAPGP